MTTTLPKTMAIDIEWPDIHEGIGCSTHYCPVARALNRWLFDHGIRVVEVSVGAHDAVVTLDWTLPSVRYFHTAPGFVHDFDAGRSVKPRTVMFARNPQ